MALFETTLLSTAYLPPVEYFFAIAQSRKVLIEQYENYCKQSYRNRCNIYSAAGKEALSIPVVKDAGGNRPIRDIRIDYSDSWLQKHERALSAAYNSSPFYLYYKDDILRILDRKETFLFDLNLRLLEALLEMVGLRADIRLTDHYHETNPLETDLRSRINPKSKEPDLLAEYKKEKTYYQVFSEKSGFIPNLSILDLLSAEGPNALSFLY